MTEEDKEEQETQTYFAEPLEQESLLPFETSGTTPKKRRFSADMENALKAVEELGKKNIH